MSVKKQQVKIKKNATICGPINLEKPKTLNGRLPLEDSSDFDDFWTEFIVMTRSFI